MQHLMARDIMSSPVVTIGPAEDLASIARAMKRHRISGLCVVDGDRTPIGIVTEGDIVRRELGAGGQPALFYRRDQDKARSVGTRAEDLMSTELVTASPTTPVRQVASLMHQRGVNRIPILDEDRLVGIVTRADIVGLFDRSEPALLTNVRRALVEDLMLDPNTFEIVVDGAVVRLRGHVGDAHHIHLIEVFLSQIDGVAEIDTSALTARSEASA